MAETETMDAWWESILTRGETMFWTASGSCISIPSQGVTTWH